MFDLKSILQKHPNCLTSRAAFKSILLDKYPSEKRMVNILAAIYECGIADRIKENQQVCENDIQTYITQLELDYGTPPRYSRPALQVWIDAYNPGSLLEAVSSDNSHRYIFPIYFLIDSGTHMKGACIGSINAAMESLVLDWADVDDYFDIRVQVITYGTGSRKLFPNPIPLCDMIWNDIRAEGASDLGSAVKMLANNIEKDFDGKTNRLYPGLLMVFSGAKCTDSYQEAINDFVATCSSFWRKAIKVGIRVGKDADVDALLAFTKNPETIINANEMGIIKRLIRWDDCILDYDY